MKKIFLIGKFNSVVQNLNYELSQSFQVQLCSDEAEMIEGLLKMDMPEMALICTSDMTGKHEEIFQLLSKRYSGIPVVCVGNKAELSCFEQYFALPQFTKIARPVKNREIFSTMCDILKIQTEEQVMLSGYMEKKSILIIDDSAMLLRMMKNVLSGKYAVKMAKTAEEAMKIIKKGVPDLIFLDYDMPDCDGKEALEMFRKDELTQHIPVVFLTGVKDRKRIQAVLALNPADYILKPVSQEQILEITANILEE